MKFPERLKKPGYKYLAGILLIILAFMVPRWTKRFVHGMTYFHVRSIEIRGTHYLQPTDVLARLRVDTMRSLFDDVAPLEARLRTHPQIAKVRITRRPPSTLVVTITENLPVALVPAADGLQPYDSAGHKLPIDPSRTPVDLPVLSTLDLPALRLLGALRATRSKVYARLSEVERDGTNDIILVLTPTLRVRTSPGVAPDRLQDIFPVESDLARRNERPAELDLRYRDQVIARLQ
jgi:cell division protein FtsQ